MEVLIVYDTKYRYTEKLCNVNQSENLHINCKLKYPIWLFKYYLWVEAMNISSAVILRRVLICYLSLVSKQIDIHSKIYMIT